MEDFTLAKIAYEAYGAFTGWKTYNGRDMPQWDDLGLPIMRAWQAAAEAVKRETQAIAEVANGV